ncbi:hypothetical protein MCOR29_010643 [Pyricularia oryzae]|nr:hypothetical protein MCOR19_006282 [Pyricularia oryzae]KAI6304678.1 hypothetical protein MCOR29_010643 [Pyricularia oryzae]KAI6486789.1 hypothetical protein MCOR18_003323 [Pyricularia oryzae]
MSQIYSLGLALPRPSLLCLGVQIASGSSISNALLQSLTKATRRYRSTCPTSTRWSSSSQFLTSKTRPSAFTVFASENKTFKAPTPNARYISLYSDEKKGPFNKVITHYVELPPSYTDHDGLPFSKKGDLSQDEVFKVFGTGLESPRANKLLRILHGRRVAGTLGDPTLARNLAGYHQKHIDTALAYLRSKLPVDEVINAGLQAEDELARLEEETELAAEQQSEADVDALIKDSNLERWQRKLAREKPQDDVYGVSVQETIRARNKAIADAAERERAEQKRLEDEEWARLNPAGTKLATLPEQARDWTPVEQEKYMESKAKLEEYTKRATSDIQEPPEMGHWERFGSCILTAGAVVVVGLIFAAVYKPPPPEYRVWRDIPPAAATLAALIGANFIVYAAWKFPVLWKTLNRMFIFTPAIPTSFASIGNAFSHQKFWHLANNMVFLWLVGTRLHDDIGRGAFLATYFGTACLASVSAAMVRIIALKQMTFNSLGASGVALGLIGAYFTIHRSDDIHVWLLPEYAVVPGYAFLAMAYLYTLVPLLGLRKGPRKHQIDFWTHFAGLVVGTAYGGYFSRSLGFDNAASVKNQARIEMANPHKAFDISETSAEEQARPDPTVTAASK